MSYFTRTSTVASTINVTSIVVVAAAAAALEGSAITTTLEYMKEAQTSRLLSLSRSLDSCVAGSLKQQTSRESVSLVFHFIVAMLIFPPQSHLSGQLIRWLIQDAKDPPSAYFSLAST